MLGFSILNYWAQTVVLVISIAVSLLAFRVIRRVLLWFCKKTELPVEHMKPLETIGQSVFVFGAMIVVLEAWGVNLQGLWTALSTFLAMVAIGFVAVWSMLSSILCALIILVVRPFVIGDRVAFPGEEVAGKVIDINFIYVMIEHENGNRYCVPNQLFFQKSFSTKKR
jgi:small-conductance mechanosensitive channel